MKGIYFNFKYIKPRTEPLKGFESFEEERYFFKYKGIFQNPVYIYAFYPRKYMREIISPEMMKDRLKVWKN